jgi:hypothetical protein
LSFLVNVQLPHLSNTTAGRDLIQCYQSQQAIIA